MPRKRTRTFYTRQLAQLKYLVALAGHEAWGPPRHEKRRYLVTCKCRYRKCLGPDGQLVEVVDGAVRAIEFLCAHNRHSTYVKGELRDLSPQESGGGR